MLSTLPKVYGRLQRDFSRLQRGQNPGRAVDFSEDEWFAAVEFGEVKDVFGLQHSKSEAVRRMGKHHG